MTQSPNPKLSSKSESKTLSEIYFSYPSPTPKNPEMQTPQNIKVPQALKILVILYYYKIKFSHCILGLS